MGGLFFGEWPAPRAPSKMALRTPLLGHWNRSWQVQPNLGALSGGPGSLLDRILRALGQLNSAPSEGCKEKGLVFRPVPLPLTPSIPGKLYS